MEIILGKKAGFCYGVNEAVLKAEKVATETKNEKIYCLGELVHNKQVIEELENKGIIFINNIDEIQNKFNEQDIDGDTTEKIKLIIRAHGIGKSIYEQAKNKDIELLDYTCPNVLAIHKIVDEYVKKDYYILIIGQKTHPEIIGTASFANGNVTVIETEDEIKEKMQETIKKMKTNSLNKILVVAQTTFSLEKFNNYAEMIKNILSKENIELEVKNTICNATKLRQEETEDISSNVDYMIVIGGKNSANSAKLYEISKKNCSNTIFIETYKELENNLDEIIRSKKVGIMAGASTPRKSIDEVINLLNSQKIHKS